MDDITKKTTRCGGAASSRGIKRGPITADEEDAIHAATAEWQRGAAAMSRELKRVPWTPQEDDRLRRFVARYGPNHWSTAARPAVAGHHVHQGSLALLPRPRHQAEEEEIIRLHAIHGNNWFDIAWKLPGRTSKDVRDHRREHLSQRLVAQGIDPRTHNKPAVAETSTSQSQTPSRSTDDGDWGDGAAAACATKPVVRGS